MKRLKVKTIFCHFFLNGHIQTGNTAFEESVNQFLKTIDAENIFQITYLNSSAATNSVVLYPRSILTAVITYWEEESETQIA